MRTRGSEVASCFAAAGEEEAMCNPSARSSHHASEGHARLGRPTNRHAPGRGDRIHGRVRYAEAVESGRCATGARARNSARSPDADGRGSDIPAAGIARAVPGRAVKQTRPPDQIVVACRSDDLDSQRAVASLAREMALEVAVSEPAGLCAQMNLGVARATGDVVALTDDDSAPAPSGRSGFSGCMTHRTSARSVVGT